MGQYFLRGVLVIAPVLITIGLLLWLFRKVDGLLSPQVTMPGLACVLFSVVLIWWISSFFHRATYLRRVQPRAGAHARVSFIYSSLRDFFEAFVGSKSVLISRSSSTCTRRRCGRLAF